MRILAILCATLFFSYAAAGLYNAFLDHKFRKALGPIFNETWRKVPPPNWRSSRGGREYW